MSTLTFYNTNASPALLEDLPVRPITSWSDIDATSEETKEEGSFPVKKYRFAEGIYTLLPKTEKE